MLQLLVILRVAVVVDIIAKERAPSTNIPFLAYWENTMKLSTATFASVASIAKAQQTMWGQCECT